MELGRISRPRLSIAAHWLAPALLLAASGLPIPCATPAALAQETARSDQGQDDQAQQIKAALTLLKDPATADPLRLQAAKDLTALCDQSAVRDAIKAILATPLAGSDGAAQVLAAIAANPDAPIRLYPMLAERLAAAKPDELPSILAALGSFRTRDAARLLGRYIGEAQPAAVSSAAMASLARLSARDDLGADRVAWEAWLKDTEDLSDSQWRQRLISALAARNDRLAAQRQNAVAQLIDSLRKLHLATKPDDRPALLASLLGSDIGAVRDLGFELVSRELAATGHLDGPVGQAALKLLDDPKPSVRANAAVLVRQLAPAGADKAVADALSDEPDPAAASDLLLAAARWPSSDITAPVLKWITAPAPACDSAAEAAWAMVRAGELSPQAAEQVLDAVRRRPVASMMPTAVSLIAALGDDDDRNRLVPLLTASSASLRQAAADALLWYPEHRGEILAAAAKDPDLFDYASRAVVVDDPTAEGLRALLALPQPSPDVARAAILRVANRVPADQLRPVASEVKDVGLKRALLTNLAAPERMMSEKNDPAALAAITSGVGDLAELELAQNRPDAALAALDAASFADGQRIACLRCTAELALGRIDDAVKLDATFDAWVRGLEMSHTDGAAKVLEALKLKFPTLTDDQKMRLASAQPKAPAEAAVPSDEVGPPSPPR